MMEAKPNTIPFSSNSLCSRLNRVEVILLRLNRESFGVSFVDEAFFLRSNAEHTRLS